MVKKASKGQKKASISRQTNGNVIPDKQDSFSKAVTLIGLVVTCYTAINALSLLANSTVFADLGYGAELFEYTVPKLSASLAYFLLIISCVLIVFAYSKVEKTDFFASLDKEIEDLINIKKILTGDWAIIFFIVASFLFTMYSLLCDPSENVFAIALVVYLLISFACIIVIAFKGSLAVFLLFSKKFRACIVVVLVLLISLLYGYDFWQSKKIAAEGKHQQVVLAFCKENSSSSHIYIIKPVNVIELCAAARKKHESDFLKAAKKIYPDHFKKSAASEP